MSNGKFYKVKCECGNEQTLFSHTTKVISCSKCNEPIAHPSGGKAIIHAEIIAELG